MAERKVEQTAPKATGTDIVEKPIRMVPAAPVKIVKRVTIPTQKFPDGSIIVFRANSAIHAGKEIKEGRGGKPKMAPADVLEIVSHEGEVKMLVCGTILKNELQSAYEKDSYIGKWFMVEKHPKAAGKDYNTYTIAEIADPTK